MSFRIVILNGVLRGERFEIDRSALTVGKDASCNIVLPDSGIGDIHALLKPEADTLLITLLSTEHRLTVNKTETKESLLNHGDVIEIGTTRLFVQHHRAQYWDAMTEFRKWRKWIAVILPLLLLAGIALTMNRCRSTPPPTPNPELLPSGHQTTAVSDPNNNDWIVTNIPQIKINSAVVLSPSPPDIMDATDLFIQARTNDIQQEIDTALKELEFATAFLAEAAKANPPPESSPDTQTSQELLQQAEASLSPPSATNSILPEAITEPATNQTEHLTN